LNEDEFIEGKIVESIKDGEKLDKIIVAKKYDPETDNRLNKPDSSKKKFKKQ